MLLGILHPSGVVTDGEVAQAGVAAGLPGAVLDVDVLAGDVEVVARDAQRSGLDLDSEQTLVEAGEGDTELGRASGLVASTKAPRIVTSAAVAARPQPGGPARQRRCKASRPRSSAAMRSFSFCCSAVMVETPESRDEDSGCV